jgi:hypothetical protein
MDFLNLSLIFPENKTGESLQKCSNVDLLQFIPPSWIISKKVLP